MQKGPWGPLVEYKPGDVPQNIHKPYLTTGPLSTRHSYQKNGESIFWHTSSFSPFKKIAHSRPYDRQTLFCCPTCHSLAVYSINFLLSSVSGEYFHLLPSAFTLPSPYLWGLPYDPEIPHLDSTIDLFTFGFFFFYNKDGRYFGVLVNMFYATLKNLWGKIQF